MRLNHVLLTENTFHAGYLVSRWRETGGPVVLRSRPPNPQVRAARDDFHRRQAGDRELDAAAWAQFGELYPDAGPADRAMVAEFGVPRRAVSDGVDYLGERLNSDDAREWLDRQAASAAPPFLYVFLDRILAPWWISRLEGRVVNAHSAVLPVARGTFAIEQVAAQRDTDRFARAVGGTVHYVDEGVDTGAVIRSRGLPDPWALDSVWACKAHCFVTAFDLLLDTASHVRTTGRPVLPAEAQPPAADSPDFKRRDFDAECERRAEEGYLWMKRSRSRPHPAAARTARRSAAV